MTKLKKVNCNVYEKLSNMRLETELIKQLELLKTSVAESRDAQEKVNILVHNVDNINFVKRLRTIHGDNYGRTRRSNR